MMLKRYTKLFAACFTAAALLLGIQPSALSGGYELTVLAKAGGDPVPGVLTIANIYYNTIAINASGQVAFHGSTAPGEDAVFTQYGLVAAQGGTTWDNTPINHIYNEAIDINDAGQVAFHGSTAPAEGAIFTQERVVVAEGDTLPICNLTLESIYTSSIAINNRGNIAFHGSIAPGETAVFTDEGQAVLRGETLLDNSTVNTIYLDSIAYNYSATVAFVGSSAPGEKAVFTQYGLEAADGGAVGDGTPIFDIWWESIAINDAGRISFHGSTAPEESAVFTQYGLVAAQGGSVGDGTSIGWIYDDTIAINASGQVAFYGEAAPFEDAVFTQDGVVAVQGDVLSDGSTMRNFIEGIPPVDINDSGQLAFFVTGNDSVVRVVRADPIEQTPVEMMEDIITFYDKGLTDDTLYGITPGGYDGRSRIRERWFALALDSIQELIIDENYTEACVELGELMLRVDGDKSPFDWIDGEAAPTLYGMLLTLSNELGC